MTDLCDRVRDHCRVIAHRAKSVRIVAGVHPPLDGAQGLDPAVHLLDAPVEERARYVLILDALNFGSGWFHTLRAPSDGADLTTAMSRALTGHARARGGCWTNDELRAMDAAQVAQVLGQDPVHELMALYGEALRQLGAWLGTRSALHAVEDDSAAGLAEELAAGMPFFADHGFYKRAQITVNDLALAEVVAFEDLDRLTVFADNLLPHVLRANGVLEYAPDLAARIDEGREVPRGSHEELELRACTVVACEMIARATGLPERILDNRLWNRGLDEAFRRTPAHRTRTIFY